MAVFLGIDPGAKGCLCFLDSVTRDIKFLSTPEGSNTPAWLHNKIQDMQREYGIHMAAIEDVHAIFGTSAGSNFSFGFNVGLIHGIVRTLPIGLELVQPKTWQKAVGITSKVKGSTPADRKKLVASIATRLYPHAAIYGPKGGLLDGRADALMIAHYLLLKYGGNLETIKKIVP